MAVPAASRARTRRILTAVALGSLAVAASPVSPAAAQVSVVPGTVTGGGTEILAVRVGTETTHAPTTSVQLVFPEGLPVPDAKPEPVAGWTVVVDRRDLDAPLRIGDRTVTSVVSSITWSGGEIRKGLFAQFLVKAGPFPDEAQARFAVVQTYADGAVERWGDDRPAGAPTLTVKRRPVAPPVVVTSAGAQPPAEAVTTPVAGPDEVPAGPSAWWLALGAVPVLAAGALAVHRARTRREAEGEPELVIRDLSAPEPSLAETIAELALTEPLPVTPFPGLPDPPVTGVTAGRHAAPDDDLPTVAFARILTTGTHLFRLPVDGGVADGVLDDATQPLERVPR